MLRTCLLYLSQAAWARYLITHFVIARRVARRFVAGETLDEAIATTRRLNDDGLAVTLDYLGEAVQSEADARLAADAYLEILDRIAAEEVNATASLKLTQLGLDVSEALCLENMRRILTRARAHGNHITIDMESSTYTDRTLRVYRALHDEHGFDNVGTVIQAYLFRSEGDMAALRDEGAFVRLCKGAYAEPPSLAFQNKAEVNANYVKLTEHYLADGAAENGAYLAVATHDPRMIDAALRHIQAHHIPNDRFEFQMLYGIRTEAQRALAAQGYTMRVYVPFGGQWYPYFMRRLAERPANLVFFLNALLRDRTFMAWSLGLGAAVVGGLWLLSKHLGRKHTSRW